MYTPFSAALRAILKRKQWQDQRMAAEVGVSPTTVSRWLNGQQEPGGLQALVDLAGAVGVSVDELLGLVDHESALIMELVQQLPPDLRQAERERLQRLVEDYQKT